MNAIGTIKNEMTYQNKICDGYANRKITAIGNFNRAIEVVNDPIYKDNITKKMAEIVVGASPEQIDEMTVKIKGYIENRN